MRGAGCRGAGVRRAFGLKPAYDLRLIMAPRSRKSVVPRGAPPRRIVVVLVAPVDELDLVGPLQVFNSVNRLAGETLYSIETVTNTDRLTVESEGGVLSFAARHHFRNVAGPVDSVLVVCGLASRSVRDAALSAWLRKMAPQVRRVGAVCVGAFLLAEAGLLKGRRATAHWKLAVSSRGAIRMCASSMSRSG